MKKLVLGIAALMVIPNIVILLLVARPRPAAAVSQVPAGGIQQILITASEWKFDPPQFTLPPAGQRVRLVISNQGNVRHNVVIRDLVNSEVTLDLGQAGKLPKKLADTATTDAGQGLIALPVEPGGTAAVEFTVGKSGTYDAVCTLKGHERRGMEAQAVVP